MQTKKDHIDMKSETVPLNTVPLNTVPLQITPEDHASFQRRMAEGIPMEEECGTSGRAVWNSDPQQRMSSLNPVLLGLSVALLAYGSYLILSNILDNDNGSYGW